VFNCCTYTYTSISITLCSRSRVSRVSSERTWWSIRGEVRRSNPARPTYTRFPKARFPPQYIRKVSSPTVAARRYASRRWARLALCGAIYRILHQLNNPATSVRPTLLYICESACAEMRMRAREKFNPDTAMFLRREYSIRVARLLINTSTVMSTWHRSMFIDSDVFREGIDCNASCSHVSGEASKESCKSNECTINKFYKSHKIYFVYISVKIIQT